MTLNTTKKPESCLANVSDIPLNHCSEIVSAYGIYYDELKTYINEKGFCLMTSGAYYMDLYKKINKHVWYPDPNSKVCDVFGNLKHFRPSILSHLGGYH